MVYEIPREIFKQKLFDRTNLCLLQVVTSTGQHEVPYKDIATVQASINLDQFVKDYSNKSVTYIFYGFDQTSNEAKKLAETISAAGYPFVFYYLGNLANDKVLDKGIN